MNDLMQEVIPLIGKPKSENLEYQAVLPTSRMIATLISAFANSNGGYIILGIAEDAKKNPRVVGLSVDFQATTVVHKAIDQLSPKPAIEYDYIVYQDKQLFAIKVEKSGLPITTESRRYVRTGAQVLLHNPPIQTYTSTEQALFEKTAADLRAYKTTCTESKSRFIEHFISVIKILDNSATIVFPVSVKAFPNTPEGKLQMRLIFSSCADSFEIYLSDLLYEIYLANPQTLKSDKTVTLKEVLGCADMQEFVNFYAKKLMSKLQRGSIKGFISENKEMSDLQAMNDAEQGELEKILQVRHLYSHRNGIVDEKFLKHYPGQFAINDEHRFNVEELLNKLLYLGAVADKIDRAAIQKHQLATT